MNNLKKNFLLGLSLLFVFSCADPDRAPLFLYGDLQGGSYIRLVENSGNFLVDLDNFDDYSHSYTVEFVDAEKGSLVESYSIDLTYYDSSGSAKRTVEDYRTFAASTFTTNEDGFMQNAEITLTSADLLSAFSIASKDDLLPEETFGVSGKIKLNDGRTYSSVNSSATVEGDYFEGYFDFTLFVGCKSDLKGKYTYSTTAISCRADSSQSVTLSGTVEIGAASSKIAIGEYEFNDWTFGALTSCFGKDAEGPTGFIFTEACGVVSFEETIDAFGAKWTYSSKVDGNDWTITWENPDSGLGGVTVITFPDGVPFTVK